ncbi:MAG: YraN family protein [Lachnospiraceae bacterium]|nr:YraN family protein [Lachnospiraceae bacterium]
MQTAKGTGAEKESLAVKYLRENGVHILAQNFYCKQGEIDIIGRHGKYLVFVEVKYRHTKKYGMPEDAITFTKRKKICKTADYYRMRYQYNDAVPVRYDVIAMTDETIVWHQNAFEHIF